MVSMNDNERLIKYWTKENLIQHKKGYFNYVTRKMFKKYLPDLNQKKILDVGCGMGMSMDYFSRHGAIVKGIDITRDSVKYVNQNRLNAIEADARYIPFKDNTFDIVYSIGVLEHFMQTKAALKEQVRVCKRGGIVIAVVPNLFTPFCVGGILFEFLSLRFKHGILTTYGRPFSRVKLENMFRALGCRDVFVQPYYGSVFLRLLFNKIYKGLTDMIEDSFLSKTFGLVLWGMGYKA